MVRLDTSSVLLFEMSDFWVEMVDWREWMVGTSFGICRWRNEGLVVGVWIRERDRAWVWRRADIRDAILGRCVGRESH